MGNMGSAHPLVEVNVSFKLEGNPSISKGVIERTRIGDGRTHRPTRQSESSIAPPTFGGGGIKKKTNAIPLVVQALSLGESVGRFWLVGRVFCLL